MGAPPVIRVSGRSARVTVSAVGGVDTEVQVDGAGLVRRPDGSIDVTGASSKIDVRCPTGTSVMVSTASGSVTVRGAAGAVRVLTSSGRVEVDAADDLEVRTTAGRVSVGRCRDSCRVSTKSGRITVGTSTGADLSSVSGRVTVGHTDRARLRTVTGRIEAGLSERATAHVNTTSGRVKIRVAGNANVRMVLSSVSGQIERKVPEGSDGADVEVTSVSGAIRGSAAVNTAVGRSATAATGAMPTGGAIVFTDIVGFTELTEAYGDDVALALVDRQDRIVRAALPPGARVVKELGDGMLLWFDKADEAITVSVDLQVSFDEPAAPVQVWVRTGVHWGTPRWRGDDIIGRDVNLASRVAALAAPGEVLCTDAAVRAAGDLPHIAFTSLGSVFVKGVREPVPVMRAERAGDATDDRRFAL